MSVKTFAAIDVGSFELTMKIFDLSGKNTMREIDCIRQRIDLGLQSLRYQCHPGDGKYPDPTGSD